MKPKEKAQELFDKMYAQTPVRDTILEIEIDKQYAKQCALITVNEILKDRERLCDAFFYDGDYWLKVKKQIEKL